ncbi:MAG: TGS domain-containing protein [Chloroflexota bacterium]|nr:TGS domain-containing protein [Chloroflexota bacterium]
MPANLPPQYFEAEKAYRNAKTPDEKVEALEAMLGIMPKHKGTDKLRAELRRRIAKFSEEAQQLHSTRKGIDYTIRSEGAGQVVLVGLPNVGKSQMVSALTEAFAEVADYPYTTKTPVPGMMRLENIQIQLLDMPPITDREAKPWFAHLLRSADVLLIIVDLGDDPVIQVETTLAELERMKIKVIGNEVDEEFSPGIARRRAVVIGSKSDLLTSQENYASLHSRYGTLLPVVAISTEKGLGLEDMKWAIYRAMNIIRVYTKTPGDKPDFEDPVILQRGSTIEDAAESVHKDFRNKLKYAQVWGSGKFDGQRVKRGYVLEDGDIIELHT